ncbi:MAG: hypothetical protein KC994_26705, partial [Candidatus Omnitrophica bacterium]|nr:hypothetical protein [Candidatus Omnitrophota bacterium]
FLSNIAEMESYLLYIPADPYLSIRWLSRLKTAASVSIFASSEVKNPGDFLPPSSQVSVSWTKKVLPKDSESIAVLPIATEQVPLLSKPSILRPRLEVLYPAIQMLWNSGFRNFEFFSCHGSRRIEIPHLLDDFAGIHGDRTAFVIADDCRISQSHFSMMESGVVIRSNSSKYVGEDLRIDYQVISDPLKVEQNRIRDDKTQNTVWFFPLAFLPFVSCTHLCPVNEVEQPLGRPEFSDQPERVYRGDSSPYLAIQIAAIMGCDPILVLGDISDSILAYQSHLGEPQSILTKFLTSTALGTTIIHQFRGVHSCTDVGTLENLTQDDFESRKAEQFESARRWAESKRRRILHTQQLDAPNLSIADFNNLI